MIHNNPFILFQISIFQLLEVDVISSLSLLNLSGNFSFDLPLLNFNQETNHTLANHLHCSTSSSPSVSCRYSLIIIPLPSLTLRRHSLLPSLPSQFSPKTRQWSFLLKWDVRKLLKPHSRSLLNRNVPKSPSAFL